MDLSLTNAQRAEVLTQALPYIKRYTGKVIVIKYGGNAMTNEQLKQQVMEDVALLWLIGVKVVLIHGGGPEISSLMDKLGKKPEFVNGLRVTDEETMDIVQMVLAGKVNKTLVNLLEMKGGKAVGLSGMDGRLIEARQKDKRLGYVCGRDHEDPHPAGPGSAEQWLHPRHFHRRLRPGRPRLQHQRGYRRRSYRRGAGGGEDDPDDGHRRDPHE